MKKILSLLVILSVATAGMAQRRHHFRGHNRHRMEMRATPKAPEFLKKGDKVAILSPSSVPTDLSIIDKGAAALRR